MIQQNWSDVAGKAVDTVKGAAGQVTDALKSVAPQVWDIVVRQARIDGVEYLLIGTILAAFGFFAISSGNKRRLSFNPKSGDFPAHCAWYWCAALSFLISLFLCVNGLDLTLNPAYWAARRVLCDTIDKACGGRF